MTTLVNWALTGDSKDDLATAQKHLANIQREVREIIRILTAEQALKAERVVKEAGRRGR